MAAGVPRTNLSRVGRNIGFSPASSIMVRSISSTAIGSRCTICRVDRKSTRLNSSPLRHLVCRLLLEKKTIFHRHQHGAGGVFASLLQTHWGELFAGGPVSRHFAIDVSFFFNDTATTEIYTLSLHDALPILMKIVVTRCAAMLLPEYHDLHQDRKSTRLNS